MPVEALVLPPGIKNRHRSSALMAATQVNLLQLRSGRLVDFLTLQVVINLRVGQTQLILIGTAGYACLLYTSPSPRD